MRIKVTATVEKDVNPADFEEFTKTNSAKEIADCIEYDLTTGKLEWADIDLDGDATYKAEVIEN